MKVHKSITEENLITNNGITISNNELHRSHIITHQNFFPFKFKKMARAPNFLSRSTEK